MSKTYIVGRSEGADILVDDITVSGEHLKVKIDDSGITATDLDSSNGSYYERHGRRHPLKEEVLRADDTLWLGEFKLSVQDILEAVGVKLKPGRRKKNAKISMYIRQPDGSYQGDV